MVDIVNTIITPNTKVISNVLTYDNDMTILQQGSVRSISRFFHQLEHPGIPFPEDIEPVPISDAISINSVGFVVKLVIFLLLITIIWDYLKTK